MITTIQAALFVCYVGFLLMRFKKPLRSISDSFYQLPGNWSHIFTLWCFAIGFLMFFQTNGLSPLFFFSGAGICFTGAAPAFREDLAGTVHSIGAYTCIISALIGFIVERHCLFPFLSFLAIAIIIKLFVKNNITWWEEISAFAVIVIGLIFC